MNPDHELDSWRVESSGPDRTQALGRCLGRLLEASDWIGLSGDLGAGKTCFVQGVAAGAQVEASLAVTSPTFVILQSYPARLPLHHLDLYRVGDMDELAEIGYDELLEGEGACLVEWWDRIAAARPEAGLALRFELLDERRRVLMVEAFGRRGKDLLASWRAACGEELRA